MDTAIEIIIHKALPNLTNTEVFELKELLCVGMGARAIEDLTEVTTEDLVGVLPIIQARKFLKYIQKNSTPSTSSEGSTSSADTIPAEPPSTSSHVRVFLSPAKQSTFDDSIMQLPQDILEIVSYTIKNKLLAGDTMEESEVSEITRMLINKAINYNNGKKIECIKLREIAQIVTKAFEKSLGSKDKNGKFLPNNWYCLYQKLKNRQWNYERKTDIDEDKKRGPKRKLSTESYGCVKTQWNPKNEDEYSNIREFICTTKDADAAALKNSWPDLFKYSKMVEHFRRLTGTEQVDFEKNFATEIEALVLFLFTCKKRKEIQDLLFEFGIKKLPTSLQMLQLLTLYFKENWGMLFNDDADNVFTPIIIEKNEQQTKKFEIYVDGCKVIELDDNVKAVIYYFTLYYVLNLKYPDGCCLSLEYIQRNIFEINDMGNKSGKFSCPVTTSVGSLQQKVQKFRKGDN